MISVHATALVVGEAGILLCGPAGAGKSSLAALLLAEAQRDGLFARLVGDDRVTVEPLCGRVIARGHPTLHGQIERRGLGIVTIPFEPACVIRLVVDLLDAGAPNRLPAAEETTTSLCDIMLPRLALSRASELQACQLVRIRIGAI